MWKFITTKVKVVRAISVNPDLSAEILLKFVLLRLSDSYYAKHLFKTENRVEP